MAKSALPPALEEKVIGLREKMVNEIEQLRKQLKLPLASMGPIIGLCPAHYSHTTSARRYGPLELLIIYRDALQDMLQRKEQEKETQPCANN